MLTLYNLLYSHACFSRSPFSFKSGRQLLAEPKPQQEEASAAQLPLPPPKAKGRCRNDVDSTPRCLLFVVSHVAFDSKVVRISICKRHSTSNRHRFDVVHFSLAPRRLPKYAPDGARPAARCQLMGYEMWTSLAPRRTADKMSRAASSAVQGRCLRQRPPAE